MKRRDFICLTISPLLFSGLLDARAQGASLDVSSGNGISRFFFDERFVEKQSLSGLKVAPEQLVPVRGDVTAVWNKMMKSALQDQTIDLQGITTESFIFCLQRLLHGSHAVDVAMQRVNRDLYAWTLTASHKYNNRSIT